MTVVDFLTKCVTKKRYFIPLLAFLLPLLVRTIPEILVGPYVVGFDTMGFYVPITLAWLRGDIGVWDYFAITPLLYALFVSLVSVGIPFIMSLKVLSVLLLGLLGLSIYYYAHKGLGWSPIKSLAPALLGTIYFVALRISWDMLRNELGIIFLFVVLTLLTQIKAGSWKQYVILSLAMVAVVLSHQLVAAIMFVVVICIISRELFYKKIRNSAALLGVTFPALIFALLLYFIAIVPVGFQDYANLESPLATWLGFSSYPAMLLSAAGFFLFCFLPLLPFVVIGFKRLGDFQLRCWLISSSILLLLPFAFVSPYRWLLLFVYPFAFFVTESLSCLKLVKWKRFKLTVQRFVIFYLVLSTCVLSFGYVFSSSERPFVYFSTQYFNCYSNQIPTSMQQNTVPVADFQSVVSTLQWFKSNRADGELLLTHAAFYSWALLAFDNDALWYYDFGDPVEAALLAKQEGYAQVFLIWWTAGEGWYAQPSLSSVFQEVHREGRIAIYFYGIDDDL
ncbi:MAG: hypothetical protein LBQ98_02145 [Nitrososphaerota archaeon]|nr:hypothetical protein [Nitrososphaerota archaeon]